MGNVDIVDLSLDEADVAAKFFHDHWRPNHIFYRNRDLLLWQYHCNPYRGLFSDGLSFRTARNGGPPLGVFAYMPFAFNRYGQRQYGCHLSAWWVHPDHRRGPLGLKLLHSLQEHESFHAYLAGINTPAAERIYERMSWVVVRNIPRLVFVTDDDQFRNLLEPVGSSYPASEFEALIGRLKQHRKEAGIQISRLRSFEDLAGLRWDEFYWRKIAPAQVGPAREMKYLQWRYGAIPIFRYHALLATMYGKVAGLLVYRIERIMDREEKLIRLVDLVAEPSAVQLLIGSLVEFAADTHISFIDFFCTQTSVLQQVRDCGFIDATDARGERYWCPHLFQPLDHDRDRLNCSWWIRGTDMKSMVARSDFCIMKGDYEFDRPN